MKKDEIKEKILTIVKNKNFIMVLCVCLLTAISISFSYAFFFTVKTNTNNQILKTGPLEVGYGGTASSLTGLTLKPCSDEEGLASTNISVINIQNKVSDGGVSNLNTNFTLTIGYDKSAYMAANETRPLTPLQFVKVAVFEYKNSTSTLIIGPVAITELPIYEINTDTQLNRYSLLVNNLNTTDNTNVTYQVKVWLSQNADDSALNTKLYLDSKVIAEEIKSRKTYTINGKLQDSNNVEVSNAVISFHNGSYLTTTNSNGQFTLTNIIPGVYNIDIISNDVKYSGNIKVLDNGTSVIITKNSTFLGTGENLYTAAFNQNTTIDKLLKANPNLNINSNLTSGTSYNLSGNFILTGASNLVLNNLVITLDEDSISNVSIIG